MVWRSSGMLAWRSSRGTPAKHHRRHSSLIVWRSSGMLGWPWSKTQEFLCFQTSMPQELWRNLVPCATLWEYSWWCAPTCHQVEKRHEVLQAYNSEVQAPQDQEPNVLLLVCYWFVMFDDDASPLLAFTSWAWALPLVQCFLLHCL